MQPCLKLYVLFSILFAVMVDRGSLESAERSAEFRLPEWLEYIQWNLTGQGQGWFHPGQSRYGWSWLAGRYDTDGDGIITRKEFKGPAEWFDRLDRNRDGVLTAVDFDWSLPSQPEMAATRSGSGVAMGQRMDREAMFKRFQEIVTRDLARKLDTNKDGQISREEWLALFDKAAKGKDHLATKELGEALALPGGMRPGIQPGSISWVRIGGMLKGETGSVFEGPRIEHMAPDFTLKTQDRKKEIRLSQYRGKKPVVLIFG